MHERVVNSTINSNEGLIVSGIGSRGGMPNYLLQQAQMTFTTNKEHHEVYNSNETSRSPIPIDPETYKNLNNNLK